MKKIMGYSRAKNDFRVRRSKRERKKAKLAAKLG
jgi:hypothetical protein